MGKKLGRFLDWYRGIWRPDFDLGVCPRCECVDVMISTHLCPPELKRPLPGGKLTANDRG